MIHNVTKCFKCKLPKDDEEVDFCEQCGEYTCFDCQTDVETACCDSNKIFINESITNTEE